MNRMLVRWEAALPRHLASRTRFAHFGFAPRGGEVTLQINLTNAAALATMGLPRIRSVPDSSV